MKPSRILSFGIILVLIVAGGIVFYANRHPNRAVPPILGLDGTVKAMSGDTITLVVSPGYAMAVSPDVRKVDITEQTVFLKHVEKSTQQLQSEQAEYARLVANPKPGEPPPVPPLPDEYITIRPQDVKVGDTISVNAENDIRTAAEFTATKVIVAPNVPPPTPAP